MSSASSHNCAYSSCSASRAALPHADRYVVAGVVGTAVLAGTKPVHRRRRCRFQHDVFAQLTQRRTDIQIVTAVAVIVHDPLAVRGRQARRGAARRRSPQTEARKAPGASTARSMMSRMRICRPGICATAIRATKAKTTTMTAESRTVLVTDHPVCVPRIPRSIRRWSATDPVRSTGSWSCAEVRGPTSAPRAAI
jgi:hypothetical protein